MADVISYFESKANILEKRVENLKSEITEITEDNIFSICDSILEGDYNVFDEIVRDLHESIHDYIGREK